jgi:hypothetical protein
LVVQVQRNVANMNNHNPEMMRLQQKVNKVETFGLPKMTKQQQTSNVALHVKFQLCKLKVKKKCWNSNFVFFFFFLLEKLQTN